MTTCSKRNCHQAQCAYRFVRNNDEFRGFDCKLRLAKQCWNLREQSVPNEDDGAADDVDLAGLG
eukprot:2742794-Pleurochrysis_carterae.AAC.1